MRAVVSSHNPDIIHAGESDAVSFVVKDETNNEGARGDYGKEFPGVVRPLLDWTMKVLS